MAFVFVLQDEKYNHLDPGDIEKVEKCLKEKIIWFEKNVNASNKQKPYENPAVLVSQIKQETQVWHKDVLWYWFSVWYVPVIE